MAEEVWRMLPPDQRRHALFSETRMRGAKQLSFCGAVAGAQLLGVEFLDGGAAANFIQRSIIKDQDPEGLGRVPTRLPLAAAPDAGDHMPPRL